MHTPDDPATLPLPHVRVTAAERSIERLSRPSAEHALASLRAHGYVVLEDAIDPRHLDALRERMTRDSEILLQGAAIAPALLWSANGSRPGHLQQSIPRSPELVFRDVVCNPLAGQITAAALGEGAFFRFPLYCCNVNCPGSVDQDVHFDPAPPGTLALNIALRDVTAENGAIELWPGTHALESESSRVPEAELERRRALVPPVRGATRQGSLLIRDLRLWHRGRANPSSQLRHMLAILHYPRSAQGHRLLFGNTPTRFARACEPVFRGSPVRPHVAFSDLPVPYLAHGPAAELEQRARESRVLGKVARGAARVAGLLRARTDDEPS